MCVPTVGSPAVRRSRSRLRRMAFPRKCEDASLAFCVGGVPMFPSKGKLVICFAHAAYRMRERFELRKTGIASFEVREADEFRKRIGEADVVVVSGMWKNELIPHAGKLKFIQSI